MLRPSEDEHFQWLLHSAYRRRLYSKQSLINLLFVIFDTSFNNVVVIIWTNFKPIWCRFSALFFVQCPRILRYVISKENIVVTKDGMNTYRVEVIYNNYKIYSRICANTRSEITKTKSPLETKERLWRIPVKTLFEMKIYV